MDKPWETEAIDTSVQSLCTHNSQKGQAVFAAAPAAATAAAAVALATGEGSGVGWFSSTQNVGGFVSFSNGSAPIDTHATEREEREEREVRARVCGRETTRLRKREKSK